MEKKGGKKERIIEVEEKESAERRKKGKDKRGGRKGECGKEEC